MPSKLISAEDKDAVVKFYKSRPMRYKEVCDKFNYSAPTVGKILSEYGVTPYSMVNIFSPELNENYFENIDSECKAYFLGLIITDGCIYSKDKKRQSLVSICLSEKDKYILEKFKKEIHTNKELTYDGRGCCSISILSNKIVKDLMKYGLTDNKSLTVNFPKEHIPSTMYRHLIRGIIDGDGSISFYKSAIKKLHIKAIRLCSGNEQFMTDIRDFLSKNVNVGKVSVYHEKENGQYKNVWSIAYRDTTDLLRLYEYLYTDATIFMKRKKKLCDKIVAEIYNCYGNTEITNLNNIS